MSNNMPTTKPDGSPLPPQRTKVVGILLALFLGGLGIDRFYLGKTGQGIGRIVLTLTLVGAIVSGIWSLVSLIQIAMDKEQDRWGRALV